MLSSEIRVSKVNPKKPLRLKNSTKYFDQNTSRSHVVFGSPASYQSRQIKIEGYETRLYWQFRYCEEHGGQTFFYTLTYNDKAIPKYDGINCFDYEDLRDLLTGGFRKQLLRKFGTTFKYFIGPELGDGKGSRGMHNNPHYHVLFFLESAHSSKFPYVVISPEEFRHLVKMYWQGFDENVDGYRDYNEAKYGIAKEGDNLGKVTNFRACCYCAKYVTKDAKLKKAEEDVVRNLRFKLRSHYKYSREFGQFFMTHVIRRKRFFRKTRFRERMSEILTWTDAEIIDLLCPHVFDFLRHALCQYVFDINLYIDDDVNLCNYLACVCKDYHLWKIWHKTFNRFVDEQVRLGLNEFRNRYSNKVRISHGVGDYALQYIQDKYEPTIQVPSKVGFKNRPLSMYYYRKLFTEVHMDCKGSPIRVLNADGIQYKLRRMDDQISKTIDKARSNVSLVLTQPSLFEKMYESDVNTLVNYHYPEFIRRFGSLLNDSNELSKILKRYAEYKLIYEDRFFSYPATRCGVAPDFPLIDPRRDYERFLVPSFFSVSRSDLRLDSFLDDNCPGYLPYRQHPYFLPYIGIFSVLDLCADYFFIQKDNKSQREAEEIAQTKRFHSVEKLKKFYSAFTLK